MNWNLYAFSRTLFLIIVAGSMVFFVSATDNDKQVKISIPKAPAYIDTKIQIKQESQPASPTGQSKYPEPVSDPDEGKPDSDNTDDDEKEPEDKPLADDPDDLMLMPGEGVLQYVSDDLPPLFVKGLQAYHSMDVEKARENLVDYLVSHPVGEKLADANFLLGLILFRQQNFRAAKGFFKTAEAALQKGNDYALYFYARCLESLNDFENAARVWGSLFEKYPASRFAVKARFRQAVNQYRFGDEDGGRMNLEKLIDEQQSDKLAPEVVYTLFQIALEKKDYKTATAYFKKLRIEYTDSFEAVNINKEIQKLRKKKIKIGYLTYNESYKRVKNLHKAYMYRTARAEATRLEKTLAEKNKYHELHGKTLLMLGETLYRGRRARAYLKKLVALQKAPQWMRAKASFLLAKKSARRMDNKSASEKYLAVYNEYKKFKAGGEALYLAAWFKANGGERVGGVKLFDKFIKEFAEHKKLPEALWYAGWNNYRKKKYDKAMKYFKTLAEKYAPRDIGQQGKYWEGKCLQKLGETEKAKAAFKKTIKNYYIWFYSYLAEERLAELGGAFSPLVQFKPSTATAISKAHELEEKLNAQQKHHIDTAEFFIKLGFSLTARDEIGSINEIPFGAHPQKIIKLARLYAVQEDYYDSFKIVRDKFMRYYLSLPNSKGFSKYPDIWELAYPLAYKKIMDTWVKENALPYYFPFAIMREESHFRPDVVSFAGAYGLMQIMPGTGLQIARTLDEPFNEEMLFSPEKNIKYGCWYLSQLLKKFNGNTALAAAAYNGGPGAVTRWLGANGHLDTDEFVEEITYRETRHYVKKVTKTMMVLSRLYGDHATRLPFNQSLSNEIKDNIDF